MMEKYLKIITRYAKSDELEALKVLIKDTIDRNYRPFLTDEGVKFIIKSGYYDEYLDENYKHCLVVEVNDNLCGLGLYRDNTIELIMIDSDIHGYGAGTKLLEETLKLISKSHDSAVLTINKGNEKGLKFFLNRGFKTKSEVFDPIAKNDICTLEIDLKDKN